VEKKLEKVKSKEKREGFELELAKLENRKRFYEKHIENGTIPKAVFAGRRNFDALLKGRVSKDEWRELRSNQLYSIGQANQKGNANLRIAKLVEGEYGLQVRFIKRKEVKVVRDGRKLRYRGRVKIFKLHVPSKFQPHIDWSLRSGIVYSVRLIRENGRYLAHISFQIDNTPLTATPERVTAIDANPEGPAIAIISRDGNILAHKLIRDERLVYASEEKRDQIAGILIRKIIEFAEAHHATVFVIEKLEIRNHRNFGKRLNRTVYAFTRQKFKETLLAKCWELEYPVFVANPAYTSILGKKKYAKNLGLSPHEAAAYVIGGRFYGYGEKLSEPFPITIKVEAEKSKNKRAEKRKSSKGDKKKDYVKIKVPARYIWSSIHSYLKPADPYMAATNGRKGSWEPTPSLDNAAVFTGHPTGASPPLSVCVEGVRKGGECGGNPQATGDRGKPASILAVDGRLEATSLRDT